MPQIMKVYTNVEEAMADLQNSFWYFDDAAGYLRQNAPEKLNEFLGEFTQEEAKLARAQDVENGRIAVSEAEQEDASKYIDEQTNRIRVEGIPHNEHDNEQGGSVDQRSDEERAAEAVEQTRRENNITLEPDDNEAILENIKWINHGFKELETVDDSGVPAWRKDNAQLLDKLVFVDENNETSDELREKSEKSIWEIAKNKVMRTRALDRSFIEMDESERRKQLRADLSNRVAESALNLVHIQSRLDVGNEGNYSVEERARMKTKAAELAIDQLLEEEGNGAKQAVIRNTSVVGEALDEHQKSENFVSYVKTKGYSPEVVNTVVKQHKSFGSKMKSFWGKTWTKAVKSAKQAKEALKTYAANNKWRVRSDIAVTAAMLGSSAFLTGGAALIPVIAYAAYAAVGSPVWPLVEKRTVMIRQAKAEGRPYEKGLLKGLKAAKAAIYSNPDEKRHYQVNAYAGAAAGIIFGGILGAAGTGLVNAGGIAAAGATNAAAGAKNAAVLGTILRSSAGVTASGITYGYAYSKWKKDDNEATRAAKKNARTGLIITSALAVAAAAWGIYGVESRAHAADINTSDANSAVNNAADGVGSRGGNGHAAGAAADSASVSDAQANAGADGNADAGNADVNADAPAADIPYPPEYSAESGLSRAHFEEIYGKTGADGRWHPGKITGILSRQNAAFDEWNASHEGSSELIHVKSPEDTYRDMMQNLRNARAADPELFKGKTDDQVMYQYIKLVEQTERTVKGPVVDGMPTRISRIGPDGQPMYWTNAEEMKAMNMMLRCGEKANIPVSALNANLDRIDLKTGRGIGDEFARGVTHNAFVGYGRDCDDGVSIWRTIKEKVHRAFTPKPHSPADKVVETVTTREVQQPDAQITTTQAKPLNADVDITSTQTRPLATPDADISGTQHVTPVATYTAGKHVDKVADVGTQEVVTQKNGATHSVVMPRKNEGMSR